MRQFSRPYELTKRMDTKHSHCTPTFRTIFPRGATFNIVGPHHPASMNIHVPNNIENGTSTARGPFQHCHPT